MKKILLTLAFLLFSFSNVQAKQNLDYLIMGTPGGTAYDNAELFVPLLEKQGYKVNKIIVDSCVGGTIYMKKSKNPTIWIQNTLEHETPGCDLEATDKTLIGVGWGRAMAFCSNEDLTAAVSRLKAGDRITFAVSNSYGQHLIDPLVEVTGTPMKFVPYGSSGKSVKGFLAGDTDMLFTNMPKAVKAVKTNGLSCWANTGPQQILDMVPMKDIFPDYKYNDIQTFTYLDSLNLSKKETKKLRKAWAKVLQEDTVVAHIEKKKLFHPDGYGEIDWAAQLNKAGLNWVGK
mgnify:CR=1 FL=1